MVRIGIIGDYNPKHRTLVAINEAIEQTAAALGEDVRGEWVPTRAIGQDGAEKHLADFDGLWAAPASPYESAEGMLRGIQYARSRNVPFTGT